MEGVNDSFSVLIRHESLFCRRTTPKLTNFLFFFFLFFPKGRNIALGVDLRLLVYEIAGNVTRSRI